MSSKWARISCDVPGNMHQGVLFSVPPFSNAHGKTFGCLKQTLWPNSQSERSDQAATAIRSGLFVAGDQGSNLLSFSSSSLVAMTRLS